MAEQAVEYMSLEFREKICDRNKTLGVDSLLTLFKAIISHYTYFKTVFDTTFCERNHYDLKMIIIHILFSQIINIEILGQYMNPQKQTNNSTYNLCPKTRYKLGNNKNDYI